MYMYMLCLVIAVANAAKILYRECPGVDRDRALNINAVYMEPCDKFPCSLIRGKETSLIIDFTASVDEPKLKEYAFGRVGFWLPFKLPYNNNCVKSKLCPLEAGKRYRYRYSIPIKKYYPEMKVAIRWMMKRPDDSIALCIVFASA